MSKFFFIPILFISLFSCNLIQKENDYFLVSVHGQDLFYSDIKHLFSDDLNEIDSVRLIKSLCEKWVKEQILVQKAKINLPINQQNIKAQVESYENSLLIYAYQKEMLNQKLDTIVSDEEILDFYNKNKENFILNDAVAKVNYVKLKKEAPYLWKVKRLFDKVDDESKLSLEDYCYQFADDYYIDDSWLFVKDILKNFPKIHSIDKLYENYRINFFHKNYYYYLYIKKYKIKGSTSPLELVKNQIRSIILNKRKIIFLENLEIDLYKNALAKNDIQYEKK